MHSKRRKKRRLFRSLLFRLTSLHQLEEQQDTLKTLLASSSQKPLSSLSSFLERTTLRGVIGTLFDIGLVLRSAESSRAIHAVLGKALEDTAVVEDREVSASSSSHFRQLQRSSKRSDTTTAGRIRCIILSELSAKPLVAPRGRRRLADCVTWFLRLLLRCREAVGLVDPRRLFPGGVGLPAEQQPRDGTA